MPDGSELGRAKLRGIESDGMILSERELELGEDHAGIMVLETDAAPGTPLAEVLPIADAVLELDLNPNRVDCMGVYGVAREVHAITGAPLAAPPWDGDAEPTGAGSVEDFASVTVEVPDLCPRFSARVFTDVEIGPSPPWLAARLIAAGMRPISNVVDITNYVMLMTAQPLHAFDLDRVPGGELIIRTAREGERMTTLDGIERTFDAETVLVCDRDGPSGIAGIMGGQLSEVSEETSRVLLEVATWNGPNILRSSSMLGLRSDASSRNEKQLHPELALRAQRIAARLLVDVARAKLVPGTIDAAADVPAPHVVSLHGARLDSLLGVRIEADEAAESLERLGFDVERGEGELTAVVPVHRHYDVSREVDLIEEVGRLHGFDRLPRTLPANAERVGGLTQEQAARRRAEDVLRDLGFDQIVAWGFVSAGLADRLRMTADDPRRGAVATRNPISEDHRLMRTTLLGGLLDAARHNVARGVERVALFESGRVYLSEPAPDGGGELAGEFAGRIPPPVREPHRLAGLVVGDLVPPSWARHAGELEATGFFALKGAVEILASQLGAAVSVGADPSRSCIPAVRPRSRSPRPRSAGSASCTPDRPRMGPARRHGLRARPRAAGRRGRRSGAIPRPDHVPGGAPGSRGGRQRGRAGGARSPGRPHWRRRAAGGGRRVRPLPRRAARRGPQEPRDAARVPRPDRMLTDAEVGDLRERIRSELEGIGGSLRE